MSDRQYSVEKVIDLVLWVFLIRNKTILLEFGKLGLNNNELGTDVIICGVRADWSLVSRVLQHKMDITLSSLSKYGKVC